MEKEQRGWEVGVCWEDGASLSTALTSRVTLASGSSSVKGGHVPNDQRDLAEKFSVQGSSQGKIRLNYCRWPGLFSQPSLFFAELKQ